MRNRGYLLTMIAVTVLATSANLAAATETIVYSFKGSNYSDGANPYTGLISDAAGNLYGTTYSGGTVGAPFDTYGTVFELTPGAGGVWTEKVLYSFGSPAGDGIEPLPGLVFDAQGNLYGTTTLGGANGEGTVFELIPGTNGTWTEKVLYSFGSTSTDAAQPKRGSLIFDSKGNLYGTTRFGGTHEVSNGGGVNYGGTVFELSPAADDKWTEKVLYNFGATTTDGANPVGGLIFDAAGNLYGTTVYGGVYDAMAAGGSGTVFELSPAAGNTWTEKLLHSFDLNGVDGANPYAGLIFDAQGNLYGTTYGGGSNPYSGGLGTVFELRAGAGGTWTEEVLHSFTGSPDGNYPYGSLIFDSAGNLYGTTSSGGTVDAPYDDYGTVFELSPTAGGGWTEQLLYNFGPTVSGDGHGPLGALIFDAGGNLYGTTNAGGGGVGLGLAGTVFKIASVVTATPTFSPASGAYTGAQSVKITDATPHATIYYSIDGGTSTKYTGAIAVAESQTIQAIAVGTALPESGLATANYQIGDIAAAPLFSPAAGTYTLPQAVTLTDAAPGATIYYTTNGTTPTTSSTKYTGPITVSTTKTIEAFAVAVGYTNSTVTSVKYTITPLVLPQEKVLYSFGATSTDGDVPYGNLIFDANGNLYGTTEYGGTNQTTYAGKTTYAGTVFELSPAAGGGYKEKILYNFGATSTDAAHPLAGLIFDSSGNLYGTTYEGGTWLLGTVFELSPGKGGVWTEKLLHSFGGTLKDGEIPAGGLIFDAKGNLYGTTQVGGAYDNTYAGGANGFGTVFELSPSTNGTWTETVLHSFSYLSQTDGYYPESGVIFDTKGNLYGTTSDGGTAQDNQGGGTVFELSPASGGWTEKVLYSFGGGSTEGYKPEGGLVMDGEGNLYGTGYSGGNGFGLDGIIFELSPVAGGGWTEKVVHSFGADETDGINPNASMVFDYAGNLYGTTYGGGANSFGAVFELTPEAGGGWTEGVLHSFDLNGTDGASPYAALTLDVYGNLYGTTGYGGANGSSDTGPTGGTVFKITSPTPAAPSVSLSAPTLTFVAQNDGTISATQTETVTNAGTANLKISAVAKIGTDPTDFTVGADTCAGATVTPKKTCTVSVTFTPSATGSLSASVSFTDNAAHSPQAVSLTGTGLPAVAVTLTPTSKSLALGGTQVFTATISNATNTTLDWYVNGVLNGNSTQGTLTGPGLTRTYKAPPIDVPSPNPAIIKVASVEDSTKFKTASVTVTDSIKVTLTPASKSLALGGTQLFTATLTGTTNTALAWSVNGVLNGNAAQGKLTGCTTVAPRTCTYTAPPVDVPSPNPAVIEVASAADPGKNKTASVTVTDSIAVTLAPASKSLAFGGTQLFTATLSGTTNTMLDWYVNGFLDGNTAQGKLTGCTTVAPRTCTFTAPAAVPSPNPAVIKVASAADPGKFKTANVKVTAP